MEEQCDPRSWQELLGQLMENAQEKKRIASLANIQPITLSRWIKGTSTPSVGKMRSLLKAIPHSSSHIFAQLVSVDFPTLSLEHMDIGSQSILSEPSSEFYASVLTIYTTRRPPLCSQQLQDLILQHMIKHFTPGSPGLSIRVARCLWHRTVNKVRSLQVVRGIGTPPWDKDLDRRWLLLGAESLAGMAVMKCRAIGASKQLQDTFLHSLSWEEHEQSALAYPLLSQSRIAGCLLVVSTQPDTFREAHNKLIERYAHLMALAFEPEAFFDFKDIALHLMPTYSRQEPLFGQFRQRTLQKIMYQSLTPRAAQDCVWQEIEEELIQLALAEF